MVTAGTVGQTKKAAVMSNEQFFGIVSRNGVPFEVYATPEGRRQISSVRVARKGLGHEWQPGKEITSQLLLDAVTTVVQQLLRAPRSRRAKWLKANTTPKPRVTTGWVVRPTVHAPISLRELIPIERAAGVPLRLHYNMKSGCFTIYFTSTPSNEAVALLTVLGAVKRNLKIRSSF